MRYILINKNPIEESDQTVWLEWMQTSDRTVNKTQIKDVEVSTMFMGVGRRVFETRVFGGEYEGYTNKYSTWDEAIAGHNKAVDKVKGKQ